MNIIKKIAFSVGKRFVFHDASLSKIREVSKTIPDVIVIIYLNWLLSVFVLSNINTKKGTVDKI